MQASHKLKIIVFWDVAPYSLVVVYWHFRGAYCCSPDDGGSKWLWNISQHLPNYMAQHLRRQPSSYLSPWEPEISSGHKIQSFCWLPVVSVYFTRGCCPSVIKVCMFYLLHWVFQLDTKVLFWFCGVTAKPWLTPFSEIMKNWLSIKFHRFYNISEHEHLVKNNTYLAKDLADV
jgi:hypothetical protein